MKRPAFRDAIRWLAFNDDNDWAYDTEWPGAVSATAALVADLFGVDDDRVRSALRKELARRAPKGACATVDVKDAWRDCTTYAGPAEK